MSEVETAPAQPPASRIRRRRRLAAALRSLLAQEATSDAMSGSLSTHPPVSVAARLLGGLLGKTGQRADDPVALRIRGLASEQRLAAEADADPAELLVRLATSSTIPAEVCTAAVAILLPLIRLPQAPRTHDR